MRSLMLLAALLLPAHPARAELVATYDQGGMPRCVSEAGDPRDALLLFWDETTAYPREIYTARVAELASATGLDYYSADCRAWPALTRHLTSDLMWKRMHAPEARDASVFVKRGRVYALPAEVHSRLAQVRLGASVFRQEATGAEFLANHPISSYDRALNRRLTAAYGVGFAAEIYRARLLGVPRNRELQQKINGAITALWKKNSSAAALLRRRLAKPVILFAQGYMQSPMKTRTQPLFDELTAAGARLEVMDFDALGTLAENTERFERQLLARLRAGETVILAGASKGVPEMLTALANVHEREPAAAAGVKAVVSLAGMFEGSFLVDWARSLPQRLFISGVLRPQAEAVGLRMENTDGFFAMSTGSLARQAALYYPRLPQSTPYFNLVGVLGRDGLTRDPEIAQLQRELAPRTGDHGANDGYIEYPGTSMLPELGLPAADIVFNASHALVDGDYEGLDLRDPENRRRVIQAIFSVVLEEAGVR